MTESAVTKIENRLDCHDTIGVYGRCHCAPSVWTDSCINIHDDRDVDSDYDAYQEEFHQLAAMLRQRGHVVNDMGTSLRVFRRGSSSATTERIRQRTQLGVQPGDMVMLSHNLGLEPVAIESVDGDMLRLNTDKSMSRVWVNLHIITALPLRTLRQQLIGWVRIVEEGRYVKVNPCSPYLGSILASIMDHDGEKVVTLEEWDGWGDNGGPGEKRAEIGQFTLKRVDRDLYIASDSTGFRRNKSDN